MDIENGNRAAVLRMGDEKSAEASSVKSTGFLDCIRHNGGQFLSDNTPMVQYGESDGYSPQEERKEGGIGR